MRLSAVQRLGLSTLRRAQYKYLHELPKVGKKYAAMYSENPIPLDQLSRKGLAEHVKDVGMIGYVVPSIPGAEKTSMLSDALESNNYWDYYTRVTKEHYSLIPLILPFVIAVVIGAPVCMITTLMKDDLYLDKTKKEMPWDWSRQRDGAYLKAHTTVNPWKRPLTRVPLPEVVVDTQDKMLEAAKQRGTR